MIDDDADADDADDIDEVEDDKEWQMKTLQYKIQNLINIFF